MTWSKTFAGEAPFLASTRRYCRYLRSCSHSRCRFESSYFHTLRSIRPSRRNRGDEDASLRAVRIDKDGKVLDSTQCASFRCVNGACAKGTSTGGDTCRNNEECLGGTWCTRS